MGRVCLGVLPAGDFLGISVQVGIWGSPWRVAGWLKFFTGKSVAGACHKLRTGAVCY